MRDMQLEHQFVASMAHGSAQVVHDYRISPRAFTDSQAATIYEAVLEVAGRSKHVTPTLVRRVLAERGLTKAAGGEDRIGTILVTTPSVAFGAMRRALADLAALRRLHDGALSVAAAAKDGETTKAQAALRELLEDAHAATDDTAGEYSTADLVGRAVEHFAKNLGTQPLQAPVLGRALGRMAPGSLTTIGGDTGAGKSSLVIYLAETYLASGTIPGIISVEDPAEVWGERMTARLAGISLAGIDRQGRTPSRNEMLEIDGALDRAREHRAMWACLERNDVSEVVAKMRRMRARGAGVLFVDYLQEIEHAGLRGQERRIVLAQVGRELKAEAKRLEVPLFLCSQLARPTSNTGKRPEPTVRSLKETGDIENMSEAVILLWRESDADDEKTLGKLAKHKSSSERPRFIVHRNDQGLIDHLVEVTGEASHHPSPGRGWSVPKDFVDR